MNYAKFYSDTNKTLVESLVSFWVPGLREEQNYIRNLLLHKEPLMAPPVFQTIFPWKKSQETFLEHATRLHILDEDFVRALGNTKNKEFSFPLSRNPYTHQTESWNNLLNNKKTIVVTSGTGSGKTECFMLPVLQDIFRREKLQKEDGVQAIFIYPLNALMKNQKNRIDAWCRALNPKITYAIYNGDTPDDIAKSKSLQMEDAYPQLISRKQIRNNPPQILFSNPTMLNYMLVRPEDRPIIEKSKGKLRWILLDEAHTYSGSAAAELALQIRRILDAFDVSIEQVNFALTSATIGDPRDPKAKIKLKEFVGQITGKQISDISVIDGSRVIPELNEVKAQVVLDNINNAFNCKVSLQDVIVLRKKLNRKTYLSLKEIVQVFNKNIPRDKGLKLVDMLGDKKVGIYADGNDGALLPTRIHLFVRCISGMYVCTNPDCKTHKEGKISLGSLTTYQTTSCQVCKKPLLEVAVCPHCGGLLMIGEQSNSKNEKFRLKVNTTKLDSDIFDFVSDDEVTEADNVNKIPPDAHFSQFILAKEERVCPRINAREIFIRLDNEKSHFDIVDPESENTLKECFEKNFDKQVCPHCGGSLELPKLKYLRASATFMGRLLAPIVLKNAESSKDKGDVDMLYEGRKYITFTDSRQNTAKSAMSLNQDVERNWIRSAIYHKLSEIRIENFTPGGGLNESDEATYQALKNMQKRPKPLEEMFEDLQGRRSGQSPKTQPVAWEVLEHSLEKNESLKRMFKHLGEARLEGTVSGQDNTPLNYLRALYVDQFGWIPKHSNSLETLGMVKVVYPPLKFAKVPIKLAQHGFTDKDWHDYLKICLDYYIRGNRHYVISDSFKQFLTQSDFTSPIYSSSSEAHLGNKKVNKWQTVTMSDRGKVSERQNRLVLLLCAALGINSPSEMTQDYVDFVDDILQEAWKFLTQNVLEMTDIEHQGYKLDLMDKNKVCVQLFDKAFICPVDNVPIDTLFRGYSPRMNGFLSKANFERFKPSVDSEIEYPYFPYPQRRKKTKTGIVGVTDTEIYEWIDHKLRINKDKGLLSSLMVNIFLMHPIFIAGEHSGQQQREVLEKYESEFNKGHLNILSCSTTMEMGVDLKGISEVIMNDVPPKPSNYLQRAGRAGRRQETKALALTFCAPNPIGMSAWKNPGWSMDHLTEMGQVRLESIQIVQRQVNAFIFSKYVISRGGIKIRSSIDDFFGGEVSLCDSFCDFLDNISNHQKSYSDLIGEYQQLVKGTVLSTLVLEDAAYQCKKSLQLIKDIYNARITAFDKIIEDTEDASPRQRYAVTNRKKIFMIILNWVINNFEYSPIFITFASIIKTSSK
ncbi:MAG: DEAD/DEAH box helicase [Prevotella sp.]|jgi:superfamily II DNA/RNA helicase|nr:DEAD/DEAH box helicase [Prevotella sp.]